MITLKEGTESKNVPEWIHVVILIYFALAVFTSVTHHLLYECIG